MVGLSTKDTTADSAGYCSHEPTIALLACSGIGGAILILLLSVRVVGVLRWGVLIVGSLLRELVRGIARWVLSAALRSAYYTQSVVYWNHKEGLLTMLVAEAGLVHRTEHRHIGRAGIHHGLERRIAGCTADRRTGCRHTVVVAVAAGCHRTEVGEDLADSHHILAAGLGSRTGPGPGSGCCCTRKGLT
jgi:hypothetical protein